MSTTVLCGVDWPEESRAAVRVARRLAMGLEARLVLAHVAPRPIAEPVAMLPDGQPYGLQEERDAEELLDEVAASERLDESVERRIEFGDPVERLSALAVAERADFLVVSSGRRRGLRPRLHKGTAAELTGHPPCPVVVVPVDPET